MAELCRKESVEKMLLLQIIRLLSEQLSYGRKKCLDSFLAAIFNQKDLVRDNTSIFSLNKLMRIVI